MIPNPNNKAAGPEANAKLAPIMIPGPIIPARAIKLRCRSFNPCLRPVVESYDIEWSLSSSCDRISSKFLVGSDI